MASQIIKLNNHMSRKSLALAIAVYIPNEETFKKFQKE